MVASFDVERVVEALPGFLHFELICGWCGWRERIGLDKVPIASFVHARDVVVLIVDDERLRIEAIREPIHDERHDRGFRVAARTPKAPFKLFEPQELKDMMALILHEALKLQNRARPRDREQQALLSLSTKQVRIQHP